MCGNEVKAPWEYEGRTRLRPIVVHKREISVGPYSVLLLYTAQGQDIDNNGKT